jgi:hypothetical protein
MCESSQVGVMRESSIAKSYQIGKVIYVPKNEGFKLVEK